jgi:hypothetical protein
MPSFRSLNDVGNYAVNTATNALDVSGSGKLAKFGHSLLKEIAKETVVQTLSKEIGENTASALLSIIPLPTPIASEYFYTRTIGEIVISASKSYAGDFAVASLISNPLRNAIGGELGVHGNSVNSPKPSGYYEIEFESGKKYHGVGDEKRMMQSANQKSLDYSDPIKSTNYTKTANRAEAYKLEQMGIERDKLMKVPGSKSYNKINSPGKKLLRLLK